MNEKTVTPSWETFGFPVKVQNQPGNAVWEQYRSELQQLKARLLQPILEQAQDPDLCQRLRLAANEALAAAWSVPRPFLLFPYLLEQKVREVQQWFRRQEKIRSETRDILQSDMSLAGAW
jgi:hypothetical protein